MTLWAVNIAKIIRSYINKTKGEGSDCADYYGWAGVGRPS